MQPFIDTDYTQKIARIRKIFYVKMGIHAFTAIEHTPDR